MQVYYSCLMANAFIAKILHRLLAELIRCTHVHAVEQFESVQPVQEGVIAGVGGHRGAVQSQLLQLLTVHQTLHILRPVNSTPANSSPNTQHPQACK